MMVPLAGICDTAFLGHLTDLDKLAGVILGSILFDYLYRILKFLRNSTNALTAEAVGKEDDAGVILAGLRCGLVAVAIAVVILLLQYPIQSFGFTLLAGDPAVELSGLEYFNARIWGAPAVLLNFALIGWFLGREMNPVVLAISLVGNGSNVLLDYLMIYQWDWGSAGAGWATAISQYLALAVGLVAIAFSIQWTLLPKAVESLWDRAALKSTLALKGNVLIRFIALISAYSLFTNISASFGTEILAENGLLLQIALLSQFSVNGIGMTTQTLVGNFNGKGESNYLLPILKTAIAVSIILALGIGVSCLMFPESIFGLLTNHQNVSQAMQGYTIWLVPLLIVTAIAFMLEGYFIGLKRGAVLRNGALSAFVMGFAPLALWAWSIHSNNLLWISLILYMTILMLMLVWQVIKHQQTILEQLPESLNQA